MNKSPRTAIVTGGGAGMGAAVSLRLARDGMAVGVLDIDGAAAAATAQAITAAGGRAIAVTADIGERAQVETAVSDIRSALGPVAVLVNNAGIDRFAPFAEIDDEAWDQMMKINLKGAYVVAQTVLPDMRAAAWGRIVNFSSFGAQMGAANMVHYTAAKGGIIAMTRSLAIELGRHGITVNAVAPGFIDTPMSRRAIDGNKFPVPHEQILASFPIPRIGRPEEVAAAVAFLVSDEAGYITAQLLGVNGGATV
jgi:NAD(P)-dependent dehydrogenase (short-subunit alcohol dehydrogenase family)